MIKQFNISPPQKAEAPKAGEYLRDNGDITKETEEIADLEAQNESNVIQHGLLGHYNEEGVYIVSDDITSELLRMVKIASRKDKGLLFCETLREVAGESLQFVIQTTIMGSVAKSDLFIVEIIKKGGGLLDKTVVHFVASFERVMDDYYYIEMCKKFNIANDDIAAGDDTEEKFLGGFIWRRKEFLSELSAALNGKTSLMEAKLFREKIKALTEMNDEFTSEVLKNFRKLRQEAEEKIQAEYLLTKLSRKELAELLEKGIITKEMYEACKGRKEITLGDLQKDGLFLDKELLKNINPALRKKLEVPKLSPKAAGELLDESVRRGSRGREKEVQRYRDLTRNARKEYRESLESEVKKEAAGAKKKVQQKGATDTSTVKKKANKPKKSAAKKSDKKKEEAKKKTTYYFAASSIRKKLKDAAATPKTQKPMPKPLTIPEGPSRTINPFAGLTTNLTKNPKTLVVSETVQGKEIISLTEKTPKSMSYGGNTIGTDGINRNSPTVGSD